MFFEAMPISQNGFTFPPTSATLPKVMKCFRIPALVLPTACCGWCFIKRPACWLGFPWTRAVLLAFPLSGAIWLGHLALQRVKLNHMRKGIFLCIGIAGLSYLFLH